MKRCGVSLAYVGRNFSSANSANMMFRCAIILIVLALPLHAAAQSRPTGYVSTFVDFFPNRGDSVELRGRVFAEDKLAPSPGVVFNFAGFVEGLLARRDGRRREDAIVRAQDASVTIATGPVDLLAGFTRVAWGRLDELQPTDVINPLDVSRFFFEGRSEARLPVALVRGRWFITSDITLEGVYLPVFRRGRFDRLDEPTSPFNIAPRADRDREPGARWRDAQGGARLSVTTGRVDWSIAAFRGFEPFGVYSLVPPPNPLRELTQSKTKRPTTRGQRWFVGPLVLGLSRPPSFNGLVALPPPGSDPPVVERSFPRFTMFGGDFETVRGQWGVRGEMAVFTKRRFQDFAGPVPGSSFDAGVGVDRKAGDYRVSGTMLVHREAYDVALTANGVSETSRTDVSLIASLDRSFAREKYNLRLFSVYSATEGSSFVRGITTAKLRDDVALEGSIGWFIGDGRDLIGRFGDSDFAYARLKVYF